MRDREEVGPLSSPRAALAAKRAVPSSIERGRYTRRARSREIADCFCATSRRGLELEHVCVCVYEEEVRSGWICMGFLRGSSRCESVG